MLTACAALPLLAGTVCAQTLATDGFEDGDRDNDAVAEGPVNDAGDTGFTWYLSSGVSDTSLTVLDDSGGIGTGNAMQFISNSLSTRAVSAAIDEVTLAEGDQISFAFDLRIEGAIPETDRRLRFGLHYDGGTPVTADGFTETGDDPGYMAQLDTGTLDGGTTTTLRGDLPNGLLSGGTRALGASGTATGDALADNDAHRYEIRVRRVYDGTLEQEINLVSLIIDGQVALDDGVDAGDGNGDTNPLTYTFNQISIGAAPIEGVEFRIDNVEVQYIPFAPPENLFDGFEDGDRDNDGGLEGPVNDPLDLGFAWYRSRGGSSAPTIEIVDDTAGIGTGNGLDIFTVSSSTRALSASIPDIELSGPGDYVSMGFDMRMRGPVPVDSGYGFRFGIHTNSGTPVVQDGGTTVTDDDLGYVGFIDLGPADGVSTASVRGDNDPTSFMGGSIRALGGTTSDPAFVLNDNNAHSVLLHVERAFDSDLGRDVVNVELYFDGALATSGVDSGDGGAITDPVTYAFNQLTISFNTAFVDAVFDNVEVLTNVNLGGEQFCVADVNTTNTNPGDPGYGEPDGTVDGADLSFYVEQWLGGNAAVADVNTTNTNPGDPGYGAPDGTVDGADLSYYVEQWLAGSAGAGCP